MVVGSNKGQALSIHNQFDQLRFQYQFIFLKHFV